MHPLLTDVLKLFLERHSVVRLALLADERVPIAGAVAHQVLHHPVHVTPLAGEDGTRKWRARNTWCGHTTRSETLPRVNRNCLRSFNLFLWRVLALVSFRLEQLQTASARRRRPPPHPPSPWALPPSPWRRWAAAGSSLPSCPLAGPPGCPRWPRRVPFRPRITPG